MVGLFMLSQLQKLLTVAKHTDSCEPFGKLNVIFSGDFLQFSPVCDMALYSDVLLPPCEDEHTDKKRKGLMKAENERRVQCRVGRALWLQINAVVLLTQQMRTEDVDLLAMQNRIRFGEGSVEDHKKLQTRVVNCNNEVKSLRNPEWKSAIMLVCRNELRTRLNNMSVICTAKENNEEVVVCVANDSMHGDMIKNQTLVAYLLNLPDNKTEGLPGHLPLVRGKIVRCHMNSDGTLYDTRVGMKVILTDNIATELGLANGTTGIFHKLLYDDNERDASVKKSSDFPAETKYITNPLCALIEIDHNGLNVNFNGLPPKFVPIAVRSKTFNVDITRTSFV